MRFLKIMILLAILSCSEKKDKNVIQDVEKQLIVNFNEKFEQPYKVNDSLTAIDCYSKTEDYFRFIGVLPSVDKSGYLEFYNKYILNENEVNLQCLYTTYPSTEFILLPSNLTYIFKNYKSVDAKYSNSPFEKTIIPLNQFLDGYDINFREVKYFQAYINSIPDAKFERDIVYRIPLIAFSLSEFDLR